MLITNFKKKTSKLYNLKYDIRVFLEIKNLWR